MKYLKVFTDFADCLEPLNHAEIGRLFLAMLSYAKDGTAPDLKGNERFIWPNAKMNIDASVDSYNNLVKNAETARESRSKASLRCSKVRASYSYGSLALEEDKDKEKDKDKENNKLPPIIPPLDDTLAQLPEEIRGKAAEWLEYKRERREGYKPKGLHSFVTKVANATEEFGAKAVSDAIDYAMSNGYQGITWDKLRRGGRNASNIGHAEKHVSKVYGDML